MFTQVLYFIQMDIQTARQMGGERAHIKLPWAHSTYIKFCCFPPMYRGENGAIWFAATLAFFTFLGSAGKLGDTAFVYTKAGEKRGLGAFVKWYEQVPNTQRTAHLNLARLKRAKEQRRQVDGTTTTVDWIDVIAAKEIIRPVGL